jgi:hypothetical protein
MPDVLADPSNVIYIVVGALTIIFGAIWFRNRSGGNLYQLLVAGAILITLGVCDKIAESPREECARKLDELGAGTREKNLDKIFNLVSDSFKYGTYDKKGIRAKAEEASKLAEWKGVNITDVKRENVFEIEDGSIKVGCLVTPIELGKPYYAKFHFKKDEDKQFRLIGMSFYDPLKRDSNPDATEKIPGLD